MLLDLAYQRLDPRDYQAFKTTLRHPAPLLLQASLDTMLTNTFLFVRLHIRVLRTTTAAAARSGLDTAVIDFGLVVGLDYQVNKNILCPE